jgi:hypothetical protein
MEKLPVQLNLTLLIEMPKCRDHLGGVTVDAKKNVTLLFYFMRQGYNLD